MNDEYCTPPEDRILKDTRVVYTMYRPFGWFLIYENGSVEFKVEGHHVICTFDHFLETLKIASDLDTAFNCISNCDDVEKLIKHLNYEAQWYGD